jgi:hypothetical protein
MHVSGAQEPGKLSLDDKFDIILNKLNNLDERLNKIEAFMSDYFRSKCWYRVRRDNKEIPEYLHKLSLKKTATKEEVKAYIDEIIRNTPQNKSYSSDDVEVEYIARVGSQNVDVLLESIKTEKWAGVNLYIQAAIHKLANDDNRALIIKKLPIHRDLIRVILNKNWVEHARDIIVTELRAKYYDLEFGWIDAAIKLNDNSLHDIILEHFFNSNHPWYLYWKLKAIDDLPKKKLDDAVERIWSSYKFNQISTRGADCTLLIMASLHGHMDALEKLLIFMNESREKYYYHSHPRTYILSLLPFYGTNKEMYEKFKENKDRLKFDRSKVKYVLKEDDEEGY